MVNKTALLLKGNWLLGESKSQPREDRSAQGREGEQGIGRIFSTSGFEA